MYWKMVDDGEGGLKISGKSWRHSWTAPKTLIDFVVLRRKLKVPLRLHLTRHYRPKDYAHFRPSSGTVLERSIDHYEELLYSTSRMALVLVRVSLVDKSTVKWKGLLCLTSWVLELLTCQTHQTFIAFFIGLLYLHFDTNLDFVGCSTADIRIRTTLAQRRQLFFVLVNGTVRHLLQASPLCRSNMRLGPSSIIFVCSFSSLQLIREKKFSNFKNQCHYRELLSSTNAWKCKNFNPKKWFFWQNHVTIPGTAIRYVFWTYFKPWTISLWTMKSMRILYWIPSLIVNTCKTNK